MAHPVVETIRLLKKELDSLAGVPLYGLSDDDVDTAFSEDEQLLSMVDGLVRFPLISEAHGRDLRKRFNEPSTVMWLVNAHRMRKSEASRSVKTATAISAAGLSATGSALARGEISADHAAVIDVSLRKLPSDVDAVQRAAAEQTMLEHARQFHPHTLETLGSVLHQTIAPDQAQAREARELEKQRRRAEQSRWLSWHRTGIDGVEELRWRTDTETATKLRAMYDPMTGPRAGADGSVDTRPYPRRAGDALTELVHAAYGTELPDNPERKWPELLIRVDYDHVTGKLRAGTLDTGVKPSPQTMAKLACEARLTPVWMARGVRPIAVAATLPGSSAAPNSAPSTSETAAAPSLAVTDRSSSPTLITSSGLPTPASPRPTMGCSCATTTIK